ncbi:MAG: hypothetical protein M1840_002727 [Geoglossum simile]|nr:MAG: hypothetical protein M1840_002727 [Geoglossum simile]
MQMHLTTLLGLALALAAAPATAAPVDGGPDPNAVTIGSVGYGGSGCPQGTVSTLISEDRSTVTMIFDSYVASLGPGVAVTENRKNCQLNLEVKYPAGFQYSIFSADYRGYAKIGAGVTGIQKASYYFSGQSQDYSKQTTFTGPVDKDYNVQDKMDVVSWSPCGSAAAAININSQVRLVSKDPKDQKAEGLLTTDSADLKFTRVVYLKWQRC